MCLAIPGRIVELTADEPGMARVDVAGVRRKINVGLLEGESIGPGDWVLIHVGFAMSKISEQAAAEQLLLLRALGEDQQAMEEVRGYRFDGAVVPPVTGSEETGT
jgi:hydrogenase expression/formation protein HypC